MEETKKDEREPSYLTMNTLCFYDDYPCPVQFGGIEYPSVRHAVASLRTKNWNMRKKLASITNAADLKEFIEKNLPSTPEWNEEFVLLHLFTLTLLKFKNNPTFKEKLTMASIEDIHRYKDDRTDSYGLIDDAAMAEVLIKVKRAL